MITTIHARPHLHAALRGMGSGKPVVCPRCLMMVGAAREARELQRLLSAHRCLTVTSEMLQPSTAVPFS